MHTARPTFLLLLCLMQLVACNSHDHAMATTTTPHAATAGKGGPDTDPLDRFARFFLPLAGCAGLMEVALGHIAAQRATRPPVKAYAMQMVHEHSAINDEYRALMRRKGLVPPDTMMREQQLKVDSLNNSSAAELDQRYITMMVNDHAMAVRLFDMAYDSAHDAEYREWLGRMRKVVRMHHQHAVALRDGGTHH